MRIGIVAPMFPPIKSGSSHYAYRVAEGLARRKHDVFVVTSNNAIDDDGLPFEIIKTPSFMLPSTPFTHNYSLPFNFFPMNYPLVKSIFSAQEPDVVHVNGHFLDLGIMASKAAISLGIPTVVTLHTRLVHANQTLNPIIRAIDRSLVKTVLTSVDSLIALDRQMYKYIEETYGTSKSNIATIPLGLDIEELLAKVNENSLIDYLDGSRTIASLTHITALKTPRSLLHAFAKLRDTFPDLKLLFIGLVKDPRVRSWVEKLGLEDDVIFMGPVNHDLIPSILKKCIIEAHSLDFRTGFDNASIEAMALGLPVVSCVREDNFGKPWLHNWKNVVLVKPRSEEMIQHALSTLLEDEGLRRRIGQQAAETSMKYFSLDRMLDDLESLYYDKS